MAKSKQAIAESVLTARVEFQFCACEKVNITIINFGG